MGSITKKCFAKRYVLNFCCCCFLVVGYFLCLLVAGPNTEKLKKEFSKGLCWERTGEQLRRKSLETWEFHSVWKVGEVHNTDISFSQCSNATHGESCWFAIMLVLSGWPVLTCSNNKHFFSLTWFQDVFESLVIYVHPGNVRFGFFTKGNTVHFLKFFFLLE